MRGYECKQAMAAGKTICGAMIVSYSGDMHIFAEQMRKDLPQFRTETGGDAEDTGPMNIVI